MCRSCKERVKRQDKMRKSKTNAKSNPRPWEPKRIPRFQLKYKLMLAALYNRYWRLPALAYVVMQPIRYVRKMLLKLAVYQRKKPYHGCWAFKPKIYMMMY